MKLKFLTTALFVSFAALAFWTANGQITHHTVTVQDLANAEEANYLILDVRQPNEFDAGHVAESVLIPLGELQARAAELPLDAPIYVICRSGNRSRQASELLVQLGFNDVRNVEGGVLAWHAAGYELQE